MSLTLYWFKQEHHARSEGEIGWQRVLKKMTYHKGLSRPTGLFAIAEESWGGGEKNRIFLGGTI